MTTSDPKRCPYCGEPYPYVTIPALWDIPERHVQSTACGCEGERMAEERDRLQAERAARESTLKRTGIPRRYWGIPEDRTYLEAIEQVGGLFLWGDVGRGKTHLAVATAFAWMKEHPSKSVVFTDPSEMLTRFRSTYDSDGSEYEALYRYTNARLLVFDDFGKAKPSEWNTEKIEQIVNSRYNDMRPTIFTSQWVGSGLINRIACGGSEESATAIFSRITQMCKFVELDGPDRRMV